MGGDGYRAIANSLNKMGYRTIKGNPFSITAVKDILYNPTYSGKIRYNRHVDWELKRRKGYNPNYILVDGPHEPIIDKEFFQKVQDRLKLESKQPKWNHRGENLLTGLLKCPECEAAMSASNTTNTLKDGTKKRIRYYSCGKFLQQGSSVCHANSIRADKAEPFVLERLSEVIQVPEILSNVVSELNKQIQTQRKPWERELQQLGADIVETQKKLEKWEDLIKVSPELRVDLNDRIHQLEMECVNNRKRTQELVQILHTEGYSIKLSDAKKVMGLVTQLLADSDSKAAKKAILRTFIDRITVDKDSKSNYKIYMKFDDVVITKLNEQMKKEPTAGNAVGSFSVGTPLEIVV